MERQGDLEQAELILRAAVTDSRDDPGLHAYHGLALYHLSRVVTLLDSSDQRAIRADFLTRYSSAWRVMRGFGDVTLANDLYFQWAADNALTATEAAIGWDLMQSLPE